MWNSTPAPPAAPAVVPPPSPFLEEDPQRTLVQQHAHDGEAHLHLPTASTPSSYSQPPLSTQAKEGASARYGFLTPLVEAIATIHEKRQQLGLPSPGTIENLQREVKSVHLTNHFFDGARADLTKVVSVNPVFQVTHAFSLPAAPNPPGFNFGAVYGDDRTFLQGGVDDSLAVTVRANRSWGSGHTSKAQAQLTSGSGSFVQLEHDYQGADHSANLKALNPSVTDSTGIFMANYLQSLTRNFAVGIEAVVQRPSPDIEEASTGWYAKYTSDKRDWIATLSTQGVGIIQATYWQRLAEKIEVAADLVAVSVPQKREATATLGAKWDFRMSMLRAQVDSAGKISTLFEQRLAPTFSVTIGGELDHWKNTSRFGLGVNIESGSEIDPNAPPPMPPSLPL